MIGLIGSYLDAFQVIQILKIQVQIYFIDIISLPHFNHVRTLGCQQNYVIAHMIYHTVQIL